MVFALILAIPGARAVTPAAAPASPPSSSSGDCLSTFAKHLTLRLFSLNPVQIIQIISNVGMWPLSAISAHCSVSSLTCIIDRTVNSCPRCAYTKKSVYRVSRLLLGLMQLYYSFNITQSILETSLSFILSSCCLLWKGSNTNTTAVPGIVP